MDFLRDHGDDVGCFANRYLTVLDEDGRPTEKTYGLGWWRTLADLERWSESHPTHLAIFGAFMSSAPARTSSAICLLPVSVMTISTPLWRWWKAARVRSTTGAA